MNRDSEQLKRIREAEHTARYATWLEQAEFDLRAAFHSREDKFFEWSCYQADQAVEKALKSVILHGGWYPPRTHKLSVLIGLSNNVNSQFRNTKIVFRDLELFTFISRYPFLIPGEKRPPHGFIKQEDADKCISQASEILVKIDKILEHENDEVYIDVEKIENIDLENRIEYVRDKIINKFNPSRIVLFGSYGRGEKWLSTLDLMIICDTELSYFDRIRSVREVTKGGLPVVQPIVYTQKEFDSLRKTDTFVQNAIDEGREIYSNKA